MHCKSRHTTHHSSSVVLPPSSSEATSSRRMAPWVVIFPISSHMADRFLTNTSCFLYNRVEIPIIDLAVQRIRPDTVVALRAFALRASFLHNVSTLTSERSAIFIVLVCAPLVPLQLACQFGDLLFAKCQMDLCHLDIVPRIYRDGDLFLLENVSEPRVTQRFTVLPDASQRSEAHEVLTPDSMATAMSLSQIFSQNLC
jgi:hypothetical protein